MTDFAFVLKFLQAGHSVQVGGVPVVPPVKLEQVEAVHVHAAQRHVNGVFHDRTGHRHRSGNPLGEGVHTCEGFRPLPGSQLTAKLPDEVLCRAVVVGQVPSGETRFHVREHGYHRRGRVNTPMSTGNLPHAVQQAAGFHIRRELEPTGLGQRQDASPKPRPLGIPVPTG